MWKEAAGYGRMKPNQSGSRLPAQTGQPDPSLILSYLAAHRWPAGHRHQDFVRTFGTSGPNQVKPLFRANSTYIAGGFRLAMLAQVGQPAPCWMT